MKTIEQEILGYQYTVEYYHPKLGKWIVLCHTITEEEANIEKEHYETMWKDSFARVLPYETHKRLRRK